MGKVFRAHGGKVLTARVQTRTTTILLERKPLANYTPFCRAQLCTQKQKTRSLDLVLNCYGWMFIMKHWRLLDISKSAQHSEKRHTVLLQGPFQVRKRSTRFCDIFGLPENMYIQE